MSPEQLQTYFRAAAKLVLVPSLIFNKAPRTPAAQTDLLQTIDTMCRYIAAFNQAHLSQEERVMLWLCTHFTDGAASAFRTAQAEARLIPSTTGIGRASVLYRTLYNMVVLYDNPQSQQEAYSALKTLKWLGTIAKTHLHFSEVFKNYQALVAATALNPVATRAGALSWEQKFAYIHAVLPAWAKDRIRVAPEAVDTEEDLWRMLYQHEPADDRAPGRLFQLEAGADIHSPRNEDFCLPCEMPSYDEWLHWRPEDQRALFALMASNGQEVRCWRCQGNHRMNTCLAPPSLPEQQGLHWREWTRVTPVGSSMPSPQAQGRFQPAPAPARPLSAPTTYVRPTIHALAASVPEDTARFDRLEATMTTLASLFAAMVQAPGLAAAAGPPPVPLMALPTTPTPAPLLLVGHGAAPPGYIDVGVATDGRPLWARADEEAPVPFEALN